MNQENQGKQLMLAVAVAFGLMIVWTVIFPPEPPNEEPQKDAVAEQAEQADNSGASKSESKPGDPKATPTDEASATPNTADGPVEARAEEKIYDIKTSAVHAQFTSYGGALRSWVLLGEKYFDKETGEQLDMVLTAEMDGELFPYLISFPDSTYTIPEKSEWTASEPGAGKISFHWESDTLSIDKHFEVVAGVDHILRLTIDVTVKAKKDAKQTLMVSLFGFQPPDADDSAGWGQQPRLWTANCMIGDDVESSTSKVLQESPLEKTGKISWAGFVHSYFLSAASPEGKDDERIGCRGTAIGDEGVMRMDFDFQEVNIRAADSAGGTTFRRTLVSYLGPKFLDKLEHVSRVAGYPTRLEEAVDLGFLGFIAGPLLWLLTWFQGIVVNWGVAIILLTLVVKGATFPWTHKSMKSMKEMAKLQPKLKLIQAKHKDDKQQGQVESMALMKAHGVNPLAGCLPMLLQMPIWFALYRSLTVAAELYNAPFIPGWIDDLTSPDPYYVMPVLLTGMMFVQSIFTPTTAAGGMQQNMLKYGMPLMFGGFSLFFPSGLTLYIFTNTLLTAVHHMYIRRGDTALAKIKAGDKTAVAESKQSKAKEAAEEDTADDVAAETQTNEPTAPKKKSGKKRSKKRSGKKRSKKS